MLINPKLGANRVRREGINYLMDGALIHNTAHNAKSFSFRQAKQTSLRQISQQCRLLGMDKDKPRPFADIAERLKWHREVIVDMKQQEYADSIGVKRGALSLWEAGTHRLSLDGALALRNKYGLSMDFMYEGMDDALPMTLRNAWLERP